MNCIIAGYNIGSLQQNISFSSRFSLLFLLSCEKCAQGLLDTDSIKIAKVLKRKVSKHSNPFLTSVIIFESFDISQSSGNNN